MIGAVVATFKGYGFHFVSFFQEVSSSFEPDHIDVLSDGELGSFFKFSRHVSLTHVNVCRDVLQREFAVQVVHNVVLDFVDTSIDMVTVF